VGQTSVRAELLEGGSKCSADRVARFLGWFEVDRVRSIPLPRPVDESLMGAMSALMVRLVDRVSRGRQLYSGSKS
jgi:hypothetical protein